MKQVLQSRSGLVLVRDVPEPQCPRGSVIVLNAFSAISSGTERSRVVGSQKSLLARARERPDVVRDVVQRARRDGIRKTTAIMQQKLSRETAVGYSSAGQIVRVGSAVTGLAPGDKVACAGAGFANHAEVVAIPANLCVPVPAGVPLENAALTTIAAIALHAIRLAEVELGERVAVIGCGLVGEIACRLLRAAGAEIYAIDVDPRRVEDAVAGGADHGFTTDDSPAARVLEAAPVGVDAVLVTAATQSNDPLLLATEIARDRGSIVLVGDVPIEFPRAALYGKELSFRISRSYGPGRYDREYEERGLDYPIGYVRWTQRRNMESVLDLQARALLDLGPLISEIVPVDDAVRAYDRLGAEESERPRGAILLSYAEASDDSGGPLEVPARERQATAAVSPSRDGVVRIGLIGPGSFAQNMLIPAFAEAAARLELVGGGSGPSAEAAGRNLGFARVAADEAAVIEDPDVDAVVIATRHGAHAELAARALGAGKHVFCEKPLALDEGELSSVLETARASDRILLVGFNRRFSPTLRQLRSFVGDGRLLANYRISAGHVSPSSWVHDLDEGGGRIVGEVCHFLDSLVYLTDAHIRTVAAAALDDSSLPIQARDNVVVAVTFEDGSVATITYAAAGSPSVAKERLEVFAGTRTAILDDYRSLELHDNDGVRTETSRHQDKGHRDEVRAFVEALRTGTAPVALDEIENVSLAALAVVEALRSGATVAVRATESTA